MFKLHFLLILAVWSKPKLLFNTADQFRILQLTDFHFGEGVTDDYNVEGIYNILSYTNPDLVVVTGDLVSGYSYSGGNHFFQDCHEKFVQPFRDLKIPYVFILGNHDDEANMNRMEIMEYDSKEEFSYTMEHPFMTTNYFVPIYDKTGQQEILTIWAFDSNDSGCGGHSSSWGCVDQKVVEKFKGMTQQSNYGVALMHIPPPEFMLLLMHQVTFGQANDFIACPTSNTGIIDAILEKQNIQYLLVGHNHNNDYGGQYPDMDSKLTLMFGRKSGYGGYRLCCGRLMGGRVIDYQMNGAKLTSTNYIVDYSNSTILQQRLRNTFYQDECALNNGPGWGTYSGIGAIIFVYFIVSVTGLSMLCLKYYSQVHSQDASLNYSFISQEALLNNSQL